MILAQRKLTVNDYKDQYVSYIDKLIILLGVDKNRDAISKILIYNLDKLQRRILNDELDDYFRDLLDGRVE